MALEMDEHPAYVPLEYGTLYFTLTPEALGLGPNIAMDWHACQPAWFWVLYTYQ